MSRMNQVMQIGNIEGNILYYIEDYAYTYLKKQTGQEKNKYFLYGEKEENGQQKKLYIYGISEKPKMEQTYFKEYYPLGFLKINGDEKAWINLKGQEEPISGFYVFYAPNQAMQEYLVDHRKEEKMDKPEEKVKRKYEGEVLPMKETLISAKKIRKQKQNAEFKNEKFIFPVGGILIAGFILLVLTSANGQKKVEIFKEVIVETMTGIVKDQENDNFIIEEKNVETEIINNQNESINHDKAKEYTQRENVEVVEEVQQEYDVTYTDKDLNEETLDTVTSEELDINSEKEKTADSTIENNYEEYIVKNGDTLAAICEVKYGSLVKMQEICTINNIKNADYIAPGQKIYLP